MTALALALTLVLSLGLGRAEACWTVSAEPGRVIDGDTFDAKLAIWLGHEAFERVRLLGVDTPEVKTPTQEAGLAAKAFAQAWLARGMVTVSTCKRDSFGRLLGTVTRGPESLADALVQAGHGVRR